MEQQELTHIITKFVMFIMTLIANIIVIMYIRNLRNKKMVKITNLSEKDDYSKSKTFRNDIQDIILKYSVEDAEKYNNKIPIIRYIVSLIMVFSIWVLSMIYVFLKYQDNDIIMIITVFGGMILFFTFLIISSFNLRVITNAPNSEIGIKEGKLYYGYLFSQTKEDVELKNRIGIKEMNSKLNNLKNTKLNVIIYDIEEILAFKEYKRYVKIKVVAYKNINGYVYKKPKIYTLKFSKSFSKIDYLLNLLEQKTYLK